MLYSGSDGFMFVQYLSLWQATGLPDSGCSAERWSLHRMLFLEMPGSTTKEGHFFISRSGTSVVGRQRRIVWMYRRKLQLRKWKPQRSE